MQGRDAGRDQGFLLEAQGNLPEAVQSFQASLAIGERLAQSGSTNADLLRHLFIWNSKVGDVQSGRDHNAEALTSYQAARDINDGLAKADPGNAGLQRDLSASRQRWNESIGAGGAGRG
jgi:hypothetical protein